jgi:DNA-binding transcriptional LysR family regulator
LSIFNTSVTQRRLGSSSAFDLQGQNQELDPSLRWDDEQRLVQTSSNAWLVARQHGAFARYYLDRTLARRIPRAPSGSARGTLLSNDKLDIIAGEIDLALRVGKLADSNLAARKLIVFRTGVYTTPSYIARFGEPLHPDDPTVRFGAPSFEQ